MSSEVTPSFGELLRNHRAASGLSQAALSARSRISVDAISMLERGVRSIPRNSTVVRLAEALRLSPSDRDAFIAAARRPFEPATATRRRPPGPGVGSDLPAPLAHFAGREGELSELWQLLMRHGHVAIHGPAGIGKTCLAARYAGAHARDYPDGLFWLPAGSETSLAGALAGLAWRLGLAEREEARQARQVEAVVRWLRGHRRWLIVLNGLEQPVVPAAQRWLAPGLPGHLLETSRTPCHPISLGVQPLPPEDARRFLLGRTQPSAAAAADVVAEAVGRVPLTLELVAAYVEAGGCDLSRYAELISSPALEREALEHPRLGARAVRLSLAGAEVEHPGAQVLLRLCAFLAADDVPLSLVRRRASGPPESPAARAVGVPLEEAALAGAVAALRRHSLIERTGDGLRAHTIVQAAVRESLPPEERQAWLAASVSLLEAHFPPDAAGHPDRWPLCARLLPHVEAADRAIAEEVVEPQTHGLLLDRAAGYLEARGELDSARTLLERGLIVRERALGPDHADTAESVNALVVLLHEQGELAASRPILRRALTLALAASDAAPRVREALDEGLASMLVADVDRVYPTRTEALADIRRDLQSAANVRLLTSRGNELQRETFEQLLFKRPPERAVTMRVLLPVTRGSDADTHWVRARESEMGRFDPSFRPGMLAAQIDVNVRFLTPYVEVGAVELRRYNSPHIGRVLITETICYHTLYRSDAPGRDSIVVRYRRGPTYDWLSRYFEMIWESSDVARP